MRFPASQPQRYVEPFGGAGWILFASDCHAPFEVFNDLDGELINLFRCVKYHCHELQNEIRWILNSRELFDDAKAQQACRGFTDIQRAAQHYLLIKLSYGSNVRSYGGAKKNLIKARTFLTDVQQRLNQVKIECKDFGDIIKQYDSPTTLFYLDPPYFGTEKYYSEQFSLDAHIRLKELLKAIKGSFILSYNNDPTVYSWYEGFQIEAISRNNNMTSRHNDINHEYKELIIRNFSE